MGTNRIGTITEVKNINNLTLLNLVRNTLYETWGDNYLLEADLKALKEIMRESMEFIIVDNRLFEIISEQYSDDCINYEPEEIEFKIVRNYDLESSELIKEIEEIILEGIKENIFKKD